MQNSLWFNKYEQTRQTDRQRESGEGGTWNKCTDTRFYCGNHTQVLVKLVQVSGKVSVF